MPLQDNQPVQIGVTVVLLILSVLMVIARYYVRWTNRSYGLDDAFMAVGIVFFIFQGVTTIGSALNGIGLQTEHITSQRMYIQGGKWFYFYNLAYTVAATFVRLSVLATLMRLVTTRPYKISIYVVSFLVSIMGLQNLIFLIAQCKPIAWYWDKTIIPAGHCFPGTAISANTITVNFVPAATDIFSAVLPMFLLWNVNMNLKTKISVCIMLGLGVFACVAIVVRLPTTVNLQYHQTSFYSVSVTVTWAAAETGVGIIAACLSTLRPLLRRLTGSQSDNSYTHGAYASGKAPPRSGMFRSAHRNDGITRLSEAASSETWGGGNAITSDLKEEKPYELKGMKGGFITSTVVTTGGSFNNWESILETNEGEAGGDANSETDILEGQDGHRAEGIKMEREFTVVSVKDSK